MLILLFVVVPTLIVAGYAVNWAQRTIGLGDRPALEAWMQRLYDREHCTLTL